MEFRLSPVLRNPDQWLARSGSPQYIRIWARAALRIFGRGMLQVRVIYDDEVTCQTFPRASRSESPSCHCCLGAKRRTAEEFKLITANGTPGGNMCLMKK